MYHGRRLKPTNPVGVFRRKELSYMKKLKVGIVGTGTLSETHISAFKHNENVEIIALCDQNV
jgi:ornithine cyclodeaminase/alanine dehydrogenase-like protein (mu-crystallin family)